MLRSRKSTPTFEALTAFKPQYLQLQPQMRTVNRSQQTISTMMKAEAVKSGIAKLR